jgi:hypothetical protein
MMTVKEFFKYMESPESQRDQEDYFEKLYGSSVAAKLCEKPSRLSSKEDQPGPIMQEFKTFRKVNWK